MNMIRRPRKIGAELRKDVVSRRGMYLEDARYQEFAAECYAIGKSVSEVVEGLMQLWLDARKAEKS
jgi:hypothetical protein